MTRYRVNEVFCSLQGEGHRAGTVNVFVRFAGCNLTCSRDGEAGFDCDTEFASGRALSGHELLGEAVAVLNAASDAFNASRTREAAEHAAPWVIFTGGEPALQLDGALLDTFSGGGWRMAVETNGTHPLPGGLDWIACSPKSAEHTLRLERADELRYVRHVGQAIPRPTLRAEHLFVSPAFEPDGTLHPDTLRWCVALVKSHPRWRLSVQQHKLWRVR